MSEAEACFHPTLSYIKSSDFREQLFHKHFSDFASTAALLYLNNE